MQDNSLSSAGVAALISERSGQEVTTERIENQLRQGDKLPKFWEEALGLPSREPAQEPPLPDGSGRQGETSPEPDPGNLIRPLPKPIEIRDELDWRSAKESIESIYITIGAGVAQIRRNPKIAVVFKQGASVLADDWIRLARVDVRVRNAIEKMMVVGPGGRLAMDHLILVGKLVSLEKPSVPGALHQQVPTPQEFFDGEPADDGAGGRVAAA